MPAAASSEPGDDAGDGKPDATSDQDNVVTGSPAFKVWSLDVIDHAKGDHKQSSNEDSVPKPNNISLSPMHANLADLKLHSPSEIIGTPFDVDSPRFEYPFPDSSSPGSDQPPTLPTLTSSLSASSISSASSSASSASLNPSYSPVSMYGASYLQTPVLPALSPIRTKVRVDTDSVPVPPSVVEKRRRRSLGLAQRANDVEELSYDTSKSIGQR